MGEPKTFTREKLVCGILLGGESSRDSVVSELETAFGTVDFASELFPFTFTDYYTREMGEGIQRCFVSFKDLIDPSTLAEVKMTSNRIEQRFLSGGKRQVNLDPGILNLARLVLASTKDAPQRIPLRRGIYAEVTLVYRQKNFHALEWTYPDYRSERYKQILKEIRGLYRQQLRQQ
jgi:hypothetical protein